LGYEIGPPVPRLRAAGNPGYDYAMDRACDRRSFVRRLALLGFGAPFLASCVHAPRRSPLRRVGFINGDMPPLTAAFEGELRRLGYVEGQNIEIVIRLLTGAPGELQRYVDELARMDLDLIVAGALPMALAVREANPAMPMVIATCPGMISNGFAQSLERPGGLVTGMDELPPGVTARRLTLLKTAAPQVSRIALLSTTPGKGGHETQLADAEHAAASLGLSVKAYRATSDAELEGALAAIVADARDGLLNFQGGLSLRKRQLIVDFVAAHRLPAIYQATLFAEAGGLMAWAPDLPAQYRTAAGYVDKILQGARPGDLPIIHPPKYFLTINAATARGLGLAIPPALLAEADRVLDS
jgi:putative tryptophan/tyrosine transport system substrate-binding protein